MSADKFRHGEETGDLLSPLRLPCGVVLKNRLAKSAMTENLADGHSRATYRHENLYAAWAQSGAALIMTGNVQVDRRYLEETGNVAIDGPQDSLALDALKRWARAGSAGGTELWVQIGHAGRQTFTHINPHPVGPSAVKSPDRGTRKNGVPRPLEDDEIEDVIHRFAYVAGVVQEAGFTGVQLHGAHGYLISSFLSPRANRREDKWGGPLENRARLLMTTVRAVRARVGSAFPLSIKLNVSDFIEGGFTHEECLQVVAWLNDEGIDLLELSGGSYESPAMAGVPVSDPHLGEATQPDNYFLGYAKRICAVAKMPVMVTGGFRSRADMTDALRNGATDVIGLARPFGAGPEAVQDLLSGKTAVMRTIEKEAPSPLVSHFWCMAQMQRMSEGKPVDPGLGFEDAQEQALGFMRNVRTAYQYPAGITPE